MRKKSKCCSALTSDTRRLASTFPKSVVHVVKLCTSAEDYEGCLSCGPRSDTSLSARRKGHDLPRALALLHSSRDPRTQCRLLRCRLGPPPRRSSRATTARLLRELSEEHPPCAPRAGLAASTFPAPQARVRRSKTSESRSLCSPVSSGTSPVHISSGVSPSRPTVGCPEKP